nr:daptide biosynthesis RiPP recognition protein [uncultured Actinotalea sp.]
MQPPLTDVLRATLVWGEGRGGGRAAGGGAGVAVLADRAALDDVVAAGLVTAGTVVLVPAGDPEVPGTVPYEGTLDEPGSEATLGDDLYLFTQDYSTSAYLSVIGPTLVRVFGDEDFRAFLADADQARAAGDFPPFLLAPAARLADLPGLGASSSQDGPGQRVFVRADGKVSTSPTGRDLGAAAVGLDDLEARWVELNRQEAGSCAVCLGAAVDPTTRAAALSERPWLRRYLDAIDALRDLTARGVAEVRVAGFGGHLLPDLEDFALEDGPADDLSAAVLSWTDDAAYLRDPARGRTFRLNRDAAPAVDAVLTTGSADAASAWVTQEQADRAVDQLQAAGFVVGARAEGVVA